MHMNHLRRQLVTLAVLSFLLPGLARACSCSGPRPIPFNLLLKESDAIFVGTVIDVPDLDPKAPQSGQTGYTFTVSEAFAGTSSGGEAIISIALRGMCDSPHFEKGEQYLVYANRAPDGTLYATLCGRTQLAARAEILLRQLRAAKENKPIASLYGVLRRTQQPYIGIWRQDYEQPIANTTVTLRSKTRKVFSTRTDDSGGYSFYDLPQGVYEVSADLPQHLAIAQTILSDPPSPITLPPKSCYQHDIEAMPQTRITGHLVGPDGRFVQGGVELFAEDIYAQQKEKKGWWEYAKGEKGFRFDRVAPGNYILVFNASGIIAPDAPYTRMFYPDVTDVARAAVIHVAESDQQINADIHLPQPRDTRKLSVRLIWQGIKNTDFLIVHANASEGRAPNAEQISPDHYELTLLTGVKYEIYASQICGYRVTKNSRAPTGELFSSKFVLYPNNQATEITLVVPSGPCQPVVYPKPNQ
jgi:hypothetical protein